MKKLKNLVYILLGAGVLATVLRVLGVIFAFDTEVKYFDVKSTVNVAASAILLACVALCIIIGVAFRKKLSRDENFFKRTERVSFAVGAVLLAYGVFELYRIFALKDDLRSNQLTWSFIGVLLSFASAAYFLGSFIGSAKRSPYSILLGFGFVFWCAYVMAVNYFDVYTTLNSPLKLSMQIALIASMFGLLCEFRIRLSSEKRGQHLASSLLSTILCAYFSLPTILAYVLGKTQNLRYLFAAIVCAAISAYALRVCLLFSEVSQSEEGKVNGDIEIKMTAAEEEING